MRKLSEANIYHVVTRGTGRQIIFEDEDDRHFLHALLREHLSEAQVEVYAWCFMENHIHLLLKGPLEQISLALKEVLRIYATGFNRKYQRTGHFFQEAFKSEPIATESHMLAAVRYIHQNPLKAGLSDSCRWPWSSFEEYCGCSALPAITSKHFVLELFGGIDPLLHFHSSTEENGEYLDVPEENERNKTIPMSDSRAIEIAHTILGNGSIESIKSWSREKRNAGIVSLHNAGLSIRQIERLTGISRGIVAYTLKNHDK